MVSGTISLPSPGFFSPFPHGTRTLSVSREYLALPDGPGGFAQDYTCPALLRIPLRPRRAPDTGLSPATAALSRAFSSHTGCDGAVLQPPPRVATGEVWAAPRSLATTGGIIGLFSFPAGTKMFQFPALASPQKRRWHPFRMPGCPIRKPADQRSCAPTRGLSQLVASFVASVSQGIRHAPLNAFYRPTYFRLGPPPKGAGLASSTVLPVPKCQRSCGAKAPGWRITDSNR